MNHVTPNQLLLAALLAAVIVVSARLMKLLTFSGAVAAFCVGFAIFGFGGLPFAVPLLTFFFSSSLLSRLGRKRKAQAEGLYAKTSRRDAGQVLANGGLAALLAIGHEFLPNTREIALIYLAVLASANADTWATEVGGLSPERPRMVTTMRLAEPGTSGAVSFIGLLAALAGAALIPFVGSLVWPSQSFRFLWPPDGAEVLAVTWAGFLAALADSILGASFQCQFQCRRCQNYTERREHCHAPTDHVRGLKWVTNDVVNLASTLIGAAFAWTLLRYYAYPI